MEDCMDRRAPLRLSRDKMDRRALSWTLHRIASELAKEATNASLAVAGGHRHKVCAGAITGGPSTLDMGTNVAIPRDISSQYRPTQSAWRLESTTGCRVALDQVLCMDLVGSSSGPGVLVFRQSLQAESHEPARSQVAAACFSSTPA